MPTTEENLAQAARAIAESQIMLAGVLASIERCEGLPKLRTDQLLNLPIKIGKAVQHC